MPVSGDGAPRKIFEPSHIDEVFLGWLLHAHKGRQRHDIAARRYDRFRLWLGAPAATFSAIVGTSVFAAMDKGGPARFVIASVSIASAILTGLSTFLNLSERAEKHRSAGARYKEVIRELERIHGQGIATAVREDPALAMKIKTRLDELEESAPIVPERIYDQVERDWSRRGVDLVPCAEDLYPSTAKVGSDSPGQS